MALGNLFGSMIGEPEHQDFQSYSGPWSNQQPYLNNLFSSASNIYAQRPYTNTFGNPNSLTSAASGVLGNAISGRNMNPMVADTLSGKYLTASTNPYFSGAVNDALGLAKSQFAGMYGGAAGNNLNNSGFQEGLARSLAQQALSAYSNNYANERQNQLGLYNQERQNQLNAASVAPTFDYNVASAPWLDLAKYQGAVSGNYGSSNAYQMPWQNQMYQQMFGFGGAPAAAQGPANTFASMFSDVRLKENIERVGTHDETGIGIYKYNYIGNPTPQLGVLAQELEQVKPEAVGESSGFKTVNYKMI